MDGRTKSLDGSIYNQVFSSGTFFAKIYPMARKEDAGISLKNLSQTLYSLNASPLIGIRRGTHLAQSS